MIFYTDRSCHMKIGSFFLLIFFSFIPFSCLFVWVGSNEKLCTIRSVAGVHSVLSVYGDTVVVSALPVFNLQNNSVR